MSSWPPWIGGDKDVVEGPSPSPILLFYSYAPEDASLYADLEKHLKPLHRHVAVWHAGMATAGTDVTLQATKHLEEADVVIILVTANYMSSDPHYLGELTRAMARHNAEEVRVIPVIMRHCDWEFAPFAKLKPLPTDGMPVSAWEDKDEACTDVAKGIRRGIDELWSREKARNTGKR